MMDHLLEILEHFNIELPPPITESVCQHLETKKQQEIANLTERGVAKEVQTARITTKYGGIKQKLIDNYTEQLNTELYTVTALLDLSVTKLEITPQQDLTISFEHNKIEPGKGSITITSDGITCNPQDLTGYLKYIKLDLIEISEHFNQTLPATTEIKKILEENLERLKEQLSDYNQKGTKKANPTMANITTIKIKKYEEAIQNMIQTNPSLALEKVQNQPKTQLTKQLPTSFPDPTAQMPEQAQKTTLIETSTNNTPYLMQDNYVHRVELHKTQDGQDEYKFFGKNNQGQPRSITISAQGITGHQGKVLSIVERQMRDNFIQICDHFGVKIDPEILQKVIDEVKTEKKNQLTNISMGMDHGHNSQASVAKDSASVNQYYDPVIKNLTARLDLLQKPKEKPLSSLLKKFKSGS